MNFSIIKDIIIHPKRAFVEITENEKGDSYAVTYLVLKFENFSNFDEEEILQQLERLTNDSIFQNQESDFIESISFPKLDTKDNEIAILFPTEFSKDSEELQAIIDTLNELDSIIEVSEPKTIITAVDPW